MDQYDGYGADTDEQTSTSTGADVDPAREAEAAELADIVARLDGSSVGDDAVDEALRTLAALPDAPVRSHIDIVESAHRALQDRLADVED